jgi:outer membrane protein OmpA-like peptidoglycan-associated protein
MANDIVRGATERCEECEAAAARLAAFRRKLIGGGLLAGGALTAAAMFSPIKAAGVGGVMQIEDHNEKRILKTFAEQGLTSLRVDMSGRNATIFGCVPAGREQFVKDAAVQWCVRQATVAGCAEGETPPPSITDAAGPAIDAKATVAGKKVTLSGTVLSQAHRTQLADAAVTAFGAGNVVDELKVASGIAADVAGKSDDAVAGLASQLGPLTKAVSGSAVLRGVDLDVVADFASAADRAGAQEAFDTAKAAAGLTGEAGFTAPAAPTTAAPTTAAPTTAAPTTAAPTTAAPTTAAPTTAAPTTAAPTTAAPTTTAPATTTTAPPTTTEAPPTEAPPTEAPPTETDPPATSNDVAALAASVTARFDTASASNTSGTTELEALVTALKAEPTARLRLIGYADSRGTYDYNRRLGLARATAVQNYLVENGIDVGRFDLVGLGEANPVGDNATEAGRAANRRVELQLITPGSNPPADTLPATH